MKKRIVIFWSILIILALVRLIFSLYIVRPDIGPCLKATSFGIGTIDEDPEFKETGQLVAIRVKDMSTRADDSVVQCPSDLIVRAKTKLYPKFKFGDLVNFSGKLNIPFNFKSADGRAFDYKGYLAKDDIFYEMKSADITKISDGDMGFWGVLSSYLFALKRGFVMNLNRTLGEPYSALAAGLVVGEKSALGAQLLEDFRTVGLIHIVVLSGFNITVVADALRRMLSPLPRVWGIVIGGLGMILFGVLVGGGATVVRSCFMASLALFADISRRDYNVIRALMFAALVMLIQNPLILLHDPSFQLSFLATFGLILLASPIEKRLTMIPERFGMRGTVASTFATQIFVSPFILYMMGQLSIIGVVVNILVLPFIPITMLAVFLTGATGFISIPFFGWCAHLLLAYELLIVQSFARIPFAAIHIPQFSSWFVVGFYVVFMGIYFWLSVQRRRNSSI
ncbi:MAG: ComEC/Rec2 family competence protein [Candidatus Taylorbacteria bacterium]